MEGSRTLWCEFEVNLFLYGDGVQRMFLWLG